MKIDDKNYFKIIMILITCAVFMLSVYLWPYIQRLSIHIVENPEKVDSVVDSFKDVGDSIEELSDGIDPGETEKAIKNLAGLVNSLSSFQED